MKRIKDGSVRSNLEKEFQRLVESGQWYHKAGKIDHGLRLTEEQKNLLLPIFHSCQIPNRKENVVNFSVLMANLLERKKKRPIRVSLSPNNWKKTRYTRAGLSTIDIIKGYMNGGI